MNDTGPFSANPKLEFPELSVGYCDGLGCGHASQPCKYEEFHESCLEFQRQFNRPWNSDDPICKVWEASFRFTDRRWRKIIDIAEMKFYGKKIVGGIKKQNKSPCG
jgi:hypothetical protein